MVTVFREVMWGLSETVRANLGIARIDNERELKSKVPFLEKTPLADFHHQFAKVGPLE